MRKTWVDKYIVPNQIVNDNPGRKSVLIVLPKDSEFAGWKFWFPRKLIEYGSPFTGLHCGSHMNFRLLNGDKEVTLSANEFLRVKTCGSRNNP